MGWDHTLMRRFSNTSHFRLINQLRSEIQSYPLNRSELIRKTDKHQVRREVKGDLNASNGSLAFRTAATKNENVDKQETVINAAPIDVKSSGISTTVRKELDKEDDDSDIAPIESRKSFRDRLDEVQMR